MKQLILALKRIEIELSGLRSALMLIARNVRADDHRDTMPDVVKEKATALYLEARAAAMRGENPSDVIYGDGQVDHGKAEDQPE